ncbi:MAG: VCBS repeat-containing protein [Balneolaceae bacterium]|nr:VCBS repeat-containing protein [Balneolaceae bacterium]
MENALRSYLGMTDSIDLARSDVESSSIIINTPSLNFWVEQLAKVQYRPNIKNAFSGTGPTVLNVETLSSGESKDELRFTGTIPLQDSGRSEMISALSSENAPITLDRYISSNASSFAIFRLPPRLVPPSQVQDTTRLDSLFLANNSRYNSLAKTMDSEFSLVTYAESGFLSTGEHLFLRKLSNSDAFINQLNRLVNEGFLLRVDGTYIAQGTMLSNLIGSELCNYTDFYLNVTGDAVVISKRKGLAEIIESDRNRRRVIYYDQEYRDIRNNLPEEVSGYIFTNSDFYDFIQPYLGPDTYVNAITSQFNQLTMTFQVEEDNQNQQLAFEMRTYTREESNIPYQEQWYFPTGGSELSGEPMLADLGGSSREEIIFATETGTVYALATDGTTVMQTNTGDDQPIGSPVVFDWYGTNQQVILLAAGNKIYGWNDTGNPLPKFPFEMTEQITTPLSITDIDRNGLPEALIATANRQLHALNGRGNNINGWPVTTNAVMTSKPLVDNYRGSISVIGFSENAIHGWNSDGTTKSEFPIFINASLVGSPRTYEGNILAGAADGYLYAAGGGQLFADSLNVYSNRADSANIEAVYVSNSALSGTPSVQSLSVQSGEETLTETMILTMSSNGSVFLVNEQGQLRLTRSMGQPAAQNFSPFITDINNDGQQDIISLASFGRLYAWQILNGERIYSLPTSGMQYPIVTDLDGDGNKELIAQTREGLRSWTIYEMETGEAETSAQN